MSKIAILGDTHFGANGSNPITHDYMKKFYKDFFQYIDDHGIKTILQLGDLFDVRKHINTWSLSFFREVFLKPVIERNLQVYVLLGNHDIYYRESLQVSSVEEIPTPYTDWFVIVKEPADYVIDMESFLLVPWVCKENLSLVQGAIGVSNSVYCAGHFEFNGFELFRGQYAKTHFIHDEYKKFKKVFSGHFHHMSAQDNVLYTGTPYELTWQDADTTKGFFVLENGDLTLVENKHRLYSQFSLSEYDTIPEDIIREKHVKIKVDVPLEPKAREAMLDNVYSMKPHSVKLIETKTEMVDDKVVHVASTSISDLITDYVSNVTVAEGIEKEKLSSILMGMFVEASANAS